MIPRLLAVVAPVLVIALGLLGTWNHVDAEEARELENAGKTFNHKVADDAASAQMDRMLAHQQPWVLVLGPSYANTDSDPKLLAERLGIPASKVLVIAVPNSVGPHWLAVLKHRVYANGHRPELVVMLSGLQSMLLHTPLTDASMLALLDLLPPEGDPEVTHRVKRSWDLQLGRLLEKRGQVRNAMFGWVRDLPPYLLIRSDDPEAAGFLPEETRASLDRVLADSEMDLALARQGHAILAVDREERAYTPSQLPAPEDSYLQDITRMARANGSRIVWVRPPMSPFIPEQLDDVAPPGVQERAVALVEAAGGRFVDMRGLPMSMEMFKNEDHMNAQGGRRFTAALASALLEADAAGWPPIVPSSVTVDGAPVSTDAPIRLAGGQALTLQFDAPWPVLRGPFTVHLASTGGPVAVVGRSERGERGFDAAAEAVEGGWMRTVHASAPPPGGPWSLTVRAAADPAEVVAVGFGDGARRSFAIGDALAAEGARAPLFGAVAVEGGVLVDHSARPTWASAPPAVPNAKRPFSVDSNGVAWFDTTRMALLSDERLIGETHFGSRCSPLRVAENGRMMARANVSCREVLRSKGGRSCHGPEKLYFTTEDGTDPSVNGRQYALALDPARSCDGAAWLYPNDTFVVSFRPESLQPFAGPARWLAFGARYLNLRAAHLDVVLSVDGQEVLRRRIDAREVDRERLVWPIEPPVAVAGRDVRLTVRNLDATFYLVEEATLAERRP